MKFWNETKLLKKQVIYAKIYPFRYKKIDFEGILDAPFFWVNLVPARCEQEKAAFSSQWLWYYTQNVEEDLIKTSNKMSA